MRQIERDVGVDVSDEWFAGDAAAESHRPGLGVTVNEEFVKRYTVA